ncbi:ArdC family protein [Bradyrhizobium sp. 613_E4_N2_2]|uniref:ArdC family protein n=1 Tax=Bradyrhizobium sp. 613_E4_N2_2 TaxID=3240371 RepID=UPI003F897553
MEIIMAKGRKIDCTTATKPSLYEEITSHIIADLEAGTFPWARPWGASGESKAFALPSNAATGNPYSGINILILWGKMFESGFTSQRWLTFNQASALGGTVRKGEHGTTVCYADRFVPKRAQDSARRGKEGQAEEGEASIPFLRRYTVFNLDQCDQLPADLSLASPELPERQLVPQAEALAKATLADIRIGGADAFYLPLADTVHIPPQPAFFEQINFYRTLFHELGHWTGHPNRLNRDLTGTFGSKPYAHEELVAELTAAFVCAALSIKPTVRHADYLGSWLDVLRSDSRAIFRAASKASKAADFLLAFSEDNRAAAAKARAP